MRECEESDRYVLCTTDIRLREGSSLVAVCVWTSRDRKSDVMPIVSVQREWYSMYVCDVRRVSVCGRFAV